ncbi:MAG: transketolase C-terminal domain-containing protein [Clostridiales bacterium]|jgi:transketolase|nr:transketolase C-terminal domain-containing protein [Clostridiales bacterium]
MRAEFAQAMMGLFERHPNVVFLTADLGYLAFEKLRDAYPGRFVNAGVAEQNVVSVAAGMAHEGLIPWVYNIAPFAVLRPYEQIRNDVCMHNLPVKIVGNGGGYGYGIMGATHHTLEDMAVMRVLPNMKIYVPLVASDVKHAVEMMTEDKSPNYLRLNFPAEIDQPIECFKPWRRIKDGKKMVVIGVGPVLGNALNLGNNDLLDAIEIWAIGMLPTSPIPEELIASIKAKRKVMTIEEHYGQCGINELIARQLLDLKIGRIIYKSSYALGYPSGKTGSQKWLQEQSGLAGQGLEKIIKELVDA